MTMDVGKWHDAGGLHAGRRGSPGAEFEDDFVDDLISSIGLSLGAARRLSALENTPISQFFCEGQETSAW